jgi:hypothetical protein
MPWVNDPSRDRPRLEPEPQPPTSAPGMPKLRALRVTPSRPPCEGRSRSASRGVTGQGPSGTNAIERESRMAPLDAIARGESFTPTRSAQTPHVAGSWRDAGWRDRRSGAHWP